ncbi:Chaperone protein HtpG [Planctomycetes bacterium Poly30]|uniref:Chaperone protein HtpG n=1 Tax=Saltatorellus ferox TaxID=2528018 RepID=A0A518ETZ2_9BACT|nr:Chaperone protein HtpG [Planctomycetes bacterium Poly30]
MTAQAETHAFEAEVQQVLSLVIHSLYTNKDIFLRELISNASDALDKLRFEALTDSSLLPEGETLGIVLDADKERGVLKIADNGIGMSREELVANLGTIASSGTRRFLQAAAEGGDGSERPDLIGQFGVGFYSAFMVADEVTVETCRAGTDEGYRWRSKGDGSYEIEPAEGLSRGTVVSLHLRQPGEEGEDGPASEGALKYLEEWTLRDIVRRYSDFVEHPVQMEIERTEPKLDDEGKPIEGETESVTKLETLNSRKPLWARPKSEITDEEHAEFYRHLTHDWNEPLSSMHFSAEGSLEYTALLYLPSKAPMDLFDPSNRDSNVSLYVRRVLIQKECKELLPSFLRFVRGVVECADLPLNVSRETLQDDPRLGQIQKRLVKKTLEEFAKLLDQKREEYAEFWDAFGSVIKEGIWSGDAETEKIAKICLFHSSNGEAMVTLDEYIERMQEGQEVIHVLTGADRATVEASPLLESVMAKNEEVLYLIDPVDEWVLQRLTEYGEKKIVPLDRGDAQEDDDVKEKREELQKEHEGFLGALQSSLDDEVSEVRFTSRLKDSPAVLVAGAGGMSGHMERLLKRSGQEMPKQKRILELNPEHELVKSLTKLHGVDANSPRIAEAAEILHGQALLAEGATPKNPKRFSKLVTELLLGSVKG